MPDKSHVSMEQHRCIVCGQDYDTGAILLDKRMRQAVNEITHVAEADYMVVNDDFEKALSDIRAIIRSRRLTVPVQQRQLGGLLSRLTR